jgi:hypothetical protein
MALILAMITVAGLPAPAEATASRLVIKGLGDWNRDGHQDIVALDLDTDRLYVFPGQSRRGYTLFQGVEIGRGWSYSYNLSDAVTDWDRDGHQDIVTYEWSTRQLWLYPGSSVLGYSWEPRVGIAFGVDHTFDDVYTADWDRDGHKDLVVQAGELLHLYPGESKRHYTWERVQIGHGWNDIWVGEIADWDRDGHQDLLAWDGNGLLWLYPGTSTRGYGGYPRVQIGNGWGWPRTILCGVTDWDRDGHQDILAVQDGTLWLYPGESRRGYSSRPRVELSRGWQAMGCVGW